MTTVCWDLGSRVVAKKKTKKHKMNLVRRHCCGDVEEEGGEAGLRLGTIPPVARPATAIARRFQRTTKDGRPGGWHRNSLLQPRQAVGGRESRQRARPSDVRHGTEHSICRTNNSAGVTSRAHEGPARSIARWGLRGVPIPSCSSSTAAAVAG